MASALTVGAGVPPELVTLAHDPQTSGGLLAAIPPGALAEVEAALDRAAVPYRRVGRVEAAVEPGVAAQLQSRDGAGPKPVGEVVAGIRR